MIFHKKNNKTAGKIYSPVTGTAVGLGKVPDEVFSAKILGDGAAVIPDNGTVVSPVNGTVTNVPDTHHAYYISSDDGLEILIHIGIDTVNLKGEGFENFVKGGQSVKAGDILVKADLDFIRQKGLNPIVPVVITSMDAVNGITPAGGAVRAGKDVLIDYNKNLKGIKNGKE